jgi:hypothetical protein
MEITKQFVEENRSKRFNVILDNGKVLNKIAFFVSTDGTICYHNSRQRRYGYYFGSETIKSITEVVKKQPTIKGNAKSLYNRTHPNAWTCLREEWLNISKGGEITQDFEWHYKGTLNYRNIACELGRSELSMLKDAFENKTSFNWSRRAKAPQGRDLSIEAKVCDDGVFRAWFSSEFAGCANGDYYLLINPTTAIYYERD